MTSKRVSDDELLARLRESDPSSLQDGESRATYLPSAAQLRAASEQEHGTSGRSGLSWWKAAVPVAALSLVIGAWAVAPSWWPGGQVGVDAAGTSGGGDSAAAVSPIEPTSSTVQLGGIVVGVAHLQPPPGGYVKFSQREVGDKSAPGSSRDRYWPADGGDVYSVHYGGTPLAPGGEGATTSAKDVTYLMVQSTAQALGQGAVVARDVVGSTSDSELTPEKIAELKTAFSKQAVAGSGLGSFERAFDDLLTFGFGQAPQRATWLAVLASSANTTVSKGQHLGMDVVVVEYRVGAVKGEGATNSLMVDAGTGVVVARRHQGSVETGYGANSDISITGATDVPAFVLDAYATAQSDGRCGTEAGFPVCQLSGRKKP